MRISDWSSDVCSSDLFGKCLAGITLIGIALALFQTNPLVGLPAGWGGIIALVTARGIASLTAQLPAAQGWITGILILLTLIAGAVLWYRSLALEKPIIALRRPSLPRLSLPKPTFALAGPAPTVDRSEEHTSELQSL